MFTLYVVCLILGGALVALSIFGGGDFDADVDVPSDLDMEVEGGEGVAAAARFLSLRNAVFFTAFFGLTGTLLTLLAIPVPIVGICAASTGVLAGVVVHRLMGYLRDSESGALADADAFTGAPAVVLFDFDRKHKGKVAVKSGDRTHRFVACPHAAAAKRRFRSGDEVIVVRVEGGVAEVAGRDFIGR